MYAHCVCVLHTQSPAIMHIVNVCCTMYVSFTIVVCVYLTYHKCTTYTYCVCCTICIYYIIVMCVCVRYVPWVHHTHSVLFLLPDIATHTVHIDYCVCVCVAADIHIVCCTMGAPNQPHPECAAHPRAPASAYSPQFLPRWANHAFVYLFFLLFPPPCGTLFERWANHAFVYLFSASLWPFSLRSLALLKITWYLFTYMS